jgi:hypothetical protein
VYAAYNIADSELETTPNMYAGHLPYMVVMLMGNWEECGVERRQRTLHLVLLKIK